MSISAKSLTQAREALETFSQQKSSLLSQLREQSRKIVDLENEVQKQSASARQANEALINARVEIEALRAQLPDDATHRAFDELVQCLSSSSESTSSSTSTSQWRLAA